MTIVNFSVTATRILVAVDTLGGHRRRQAHINKIFPIPLTNMLVCGRGSLELVVRVATICGRMPGGIDEARVRLPTFLPGAFNRIALCAAALLQPMDAFKAGQEVYLFGWSDSAGEMVALRFFKASPWSAWVVDDDFEESIAPGLHGREVPSMPDARSMKRIAMLQVEQCAKVHPEFPVAGGQLIFAELTRTDVYIRSLGQLQAL